MRYLGGKSLVLGHIRRVIDEIIPNVQSALDIFAGSGVVSCFFKEQGFRTLSNDFLYFSYVLQKSSIGINSRPSFRRLPVQNPLDYLNHLTLEQTTFDINQCFVFNNYSPNERCRRMYFQPFNALKIDIIRLQIQQWYDNNLLNDNEYYYLLGSLLRAIPFVANIAGVYEAYLKYWDKRTFNALSLQEIPLINNQRRNLCFNEDFHSLLNRRCDLLYADPPYNSREYVSNYHILETIARYDYPEIAGVTGVRPSLAEQKSVFCKQRTVEQAFEDLIRGCHCRYLLISYNSEGLLSSERLVELCQDYALDNSFRLYQFPYRRYKSRIPNNDEGLQEQLFFLKRR